MLKCQQKKLPRQGSVKKNGTLNLKSKEGRKIYADRTFQMASRQRFRCAICQHLQLGMQFDHEAGRGHGGGHRTDAITDAEGNWTNAALCSNCNQWKGSRRYKWVNGFYKPVEKFKEKAA